MSDEVRTTWYGLPDLSSQIKHNFANFLNQPVLLSPKEEIITRILPDGRFAHTYQQSENLCLIIENIGPDEYFLLLLKPESYGKSEHPSKSDLVGKYKVAPKQLDPDQGILFQGTLKYTPPSKTVFKDQEMEFILKSEFENNFPEGTDEDYSIEEHNIKQSDYAQKYLPQLSEILDTWEIAHWY